MSVAATLPVKEAPAYAGNFPKFSQPKEVACFSRDAARRVRHDRSALRPYRVARLPAALDVGFESYVPRKAAGDAAQAAAPLGDVVDALASKGIPTRDIHIITYRNNLNKVFLTPYNPRDEWEVGVEQRDDGVVLLQVRETASKRAEEANKDERGQRMAYWGYKFEQLSTLTESQQSALAAGGAADAVAETTGDEYRVPSPSDAGSYDHLYPPGDLHALRERYSALAAAAAPAGAAAPAKAPAPPPKAAAAAAAALAPVNANEEFCSIVQIGIDSIRLLMAAEIDCVADKASVGGAPGAAAAAGYVELKTSRTPASPRELESFERHKLLKFWLQSFLAGVPNVVVGFRDDAGTVRELRTYETRTLHRLVKPPKGYWDTTAVINFGKGVLTWLLAALKEQRGRSKFVMRYTPASRAIVLVPDDGAADVDDDDERAHKRRRVSDD